LIVLDESHGEQDRAMPQERHELLEHRDLLKVFGGIWNYATRPSRRLRRRVFAH
jgi:hypothetical protein